MPLLIFRAKHACPAINLFCATKFWILASFKLIYNTFLTMNFHPSFLNSQTHLLTLSCHNAHHKPQVDKTQLPYCLPQKSCHREQLAPYGILNCRAHFNTTLSRQQWNNWAMTMLSLFSTSSLHGSAINFE